MNYNKKKVEIFLPDDYKEKKYVLYVICPQKGDSLGGSDAHVFDLSYYLLNNSKYTPIVLFTHNDNYRDRLKENGIPYIYSHGCKYKIDVVNSIKRIIDDINIVCIHSHQYDANYLTQELIMFGGKKWKKVPVIMTCHGWIENSLKLKIMTYFDFKSYNYADTLIAVSKKDEKRLLRDVPNKNIEYIPNGVRKRIQYKKNQIDMIKKEYGISNDNIVVSYIGRLSPEKRIDLVIESANQVCKLNDKVIYLISGNGDDLSLMKELIRKYNLEDRVKYLGFVKEIDKVQSVTDVILLTSDTEGTPRALIESILYGSIPVCTNVGGIKDIYDDSAGFKCEPNNASDISNKIMDAINLNDEDRVKMINNIKKIANDNFTIDIMAKKIIKIYERLEK